MIIYEEVFRNGVIKVPMGLNERLAIAISE